MKKLFFLLLANPVVFLMQAKSQSFDFPQSYSGKEGQLQFLSKDGLSENDGGVSAIYSVPNYQCANEITPTIEIVNYGSNLLTAALIKYSIDSQSPSYYEWQGSLEPGAVELIEFETIEVTSGPHVFEVSIIEANGLADINGGNNDDLVHFYIIGSSTQAPMVQQFASAILPEGYFVENTDTFGWKMYTQVIDPGLHNYMLQMPFFNCNAGIVNTVYMENVDLASITTAALSFDVAYRYYENSGLTNYDMLSVEISDDCGVIWNTLYQKEKDELATLPPSGTGDYFPHQEDEWRTETVDLGEYVGNSNIMIRFKAISGHGNNLYIDNLKIASTVGLDDSEIQPAAVAVYPNPANCYVRFEYFGETTDHCRVRVFDIFGKEYFTGAFKGKSNFNLDTALWPPGPYFSVLDNGTAKTVCAKFMVNH